MLKSKVFLYIIFIISKLHPFFILFSFYISFFYPTGLSEFQTQGSTDVS